PLPARYRPAEDDQLGVGRQLADMGRVPRAVGDDADVAAIKLAPEGLHSGTVRRLVADRPFGQGGMAGLVHADESRHRADLLRSGSRLDDTPRGGGGFHAAVA